MNNKTLFRKYGTLTKGVKMTYLEEEGIIFEDENKGVFNGEVAEMEIHPIRYKFVEGLRILGYAFNSAIGEFVDNSKDAGARNINIQLNSDKKKDLVEVIIQDDGSGMTEEQLKNCFTLGADREYVEGDTGKFGKGGTEGSLSFARKKTVYTKKGKIILGRKYDLDIIEKRDFWGSVPVTPPENIVRQFGNKDGTIILHENIDLAKNKASTLANKLDPYLCRTYYDKLFQEDFNITLNEKKLEPFDPLCLDDPDVEILKNESIPVNGHEIVVKAVYLKDVKEVVSCPGAETLSSLAGGYAIREGRILNPVPMNTSNSGLDGIYNSLHSDYRHLRWSVEFKSDLDIEMGTTTLKNSIRMNQSVRDKVKKIIEDAKSITTVRVNAYKNRQHAKVQAEVAGVTKKKLNKTTSDVLVDITLEDLKNTGPLGSVTPAVTASEFDYEICLNRSHPAISSASKMNRAAQEKFMNILASFLVGVQTTHDSSGLELDDFKEDLIVKISSIARSVARLK